MGKSNGVQIGIGVLIGLTGGFLLAALASVDVPNAKPAVAPMVPSVVLEALTWPEVANRMDEGSRSVLIPTGGLEQNGIHMVLGKHNYIVAKTAREIALRHGALLVAPVMAYVPEGEIDPPTGHMQYPGTISLSEETFAAVLRDTVRSLAAHGFTDFYLVGDSGSTQAAQEAVAKEFRAAGVRVHNLLAYYDFNVNGEIEFLLSNGETYDSIGHHAGIRDTSELLGVYPDGVRSADGLPRGITDTGANGTFSHASVAYGTELLELKIAAALKQIAEIESGE